MTATLQRLRWLALLVALVLVATVFTVAGRPAAADAATTCGVKQSGAAAQANNAVNQACGLIGTPYSWGVGATTSRRTTTGS
jgi:cell wall-associated NlpC family hydrolase